MPDIIIRVGAARDASLSTVFAPLEQASKRAKQRLADDSAAAGDSVAKGTRRGTDEAARAFAAAAKEAARQEKAKVRAAEQAAKDKARILAQEVKASERAEAAKAKAAEQAAKDRNKAAERELKDAQRYAAKISAASAKEYDDARAARNNRPTTGSRVRGELGVGGKLEWHKRDLVSGAAAVATHVGRTALNAGKSALMTGLQGAGVDLDAGSAISKSVNLEASATKITNSAYMPGHNDASGQRQDPQKLMSDVRGVANATATDTQVAMDALDKFVAKTGDLATGRDMLASLAQISKAYGADLSDMADAAGDVSNQLGNVPNKGQAVADTMKLITAQGKEGAVEIKDLASQMAKVASAAGQFGGNKADNIALFGALTQNTRAHGGAASSTQAATSVSSFTNTFSKGARLDAFKANGVQVKDSTTGLNRNAEDIIFDSLRAAAGKNKSGLGGFDRKMGGMFADVRARSVTKGFEQSFLGNMQTGDKSKTYQEQVDAALQKTRDQFDALKTATMQSTELTDSFNAAMSTTASQAQILNNRLADSAAQLNGQLKPAIVALANAVTPAVAGLATFAGWLTGDSDVSGGKADLAAGVNGMNDIGVARQAISSGEISKADFDRIQADQGPLQASVDRRTHELYDQQDAQGKHSDQQLRDRLAETGPLGPAGPEKERIGKFLQERQSLASDEQTLKALQGVTEAVQKGALDPNAILTVRIVGGNATPPVADGTNRPNGAPGLPDGQDK